MARAPAKAKTSPKKPTRVVPERNASKPKQLSPKKVAPAKKTPKPKAGPKGTKKAATHPPYLSMIKKAIGAEDKKEGSSINFIEKYIKNKFKIDHEIKRYLKLALRRGVENGKLSQHRSSYKLKATKKRTKSPSTKKKSDESPKRKPRTTKAKKEEKPKKEKSPRAKSPSKKSPKKTPEKRKRDEKSTSPAKKQKTPSPKKTTEKKPRGRKPQANKEKKVILEKILPNITTSGVMFNTTDVPEIRKELKTTIEALLTDDNVRVAILANRGYKENSQYNLEALDFCDDAKKVLDAVENSHGEGSDWLAYYRQILQEGLNFSWANHRNRLMILIGDEGVNAVRDNSLQNDIGKLATLGVKVYAFHFSQLFLLEELLAQLN